MPTDVTGARGLARIGSWLSATPERRALLRICIYALSVRALLGIVALVALRMGEMRLHPRAEQYVGIFATWLRWDSFWYVAIASEGYSYSATQASNVAFLPGFPLAIRVLTLVVKNPFVAGLIVSHVASLAAIIVFWDWVRERAGLHTAENAVLWLLVFPYSFFFYSIYSEGLYFLLCTLALRAADRERWAHAGLWAALAALTRPPGVLLVPAFAWAIVEAIRSGARPRPVMAMALLPGVALATYAAVLWVRFGDPLAVLTAQRAGWSVKASWNVASTWIDLFLQALRRPEIHLKIHGFVQLLMPIALTALVIRAWRRLGSASGVYAALTVSIVVLFGLESIGREGLSAIPLFAALGLDRQGTRSGTLRLISLALLATFCFAFARGSFMG